MTNDWSAAVKSGERFTFGENWTRFLRTLDERRIAAARGSLQSMLGVGSLAGLKFLDIGSGSGLFSLAARQLGASVRSFDFDPASAACTRELKRRYFESDPQWRVEEGSVLDAAYVASLGEHDVVYSWGVLHHTGRMYEALGNAASRVAPRGKLFIAIYNDQGLISRYWSFVKRKYNRNLLYRWLLTLVHAPYLTGIRFLVRAATGRMSLERGMSLWTDTIDWLGGYPFEVASPEEIFRFFRDRGFALTELRTCRGRMGCNEYVFVRNDSRGAS